MSFAWPAALGVLGLVPLVLLVYVLILRRRRRAAVRYSNVEFLKAVVPARAAWKRHLPIALLLGALTLLGVGAARPQRTVAVSISNTSIMLAFDTSRSMCATDVEPNRLVVAQEAAKQFIDELPGGTRLGIVAFSGAAQLVVPPTTDQAALETAIDNFTTSRGTAIGAALLKSLEAIADVNPEVAPLDVEVAADTAERAADDYVADIVVILTDGANSRGIEPLEAVPAAVERRVRVYTIGFGTTEPAGAACTAAQLGTDAFEQAGGGGGGPPGDFRQFLVIDEPTLQAVAAETGGEYFKAESAEQLVDVFKGLPQRVATQNEFREIGNWFALGGVALASGALMLARRRS